MEYIGKEITGKKFNEIFGNVRLYKFTNSKEKHYGHQYVDGLNIDANEFDISRGECSAGGLYFTSEKYVYNWMCANKYVRAVTVPDDARICIYETKFKSDKIITGSRIRICDSHLLLDDETQKPIVRQNGCIIKHIKNPSEEVKRLAARQNGFAIQYIAEPSEEVKKLAVQQNGHVIKFIEGPSEEVKMLAVQQDGYSIKFIENPSEKVKMLAVQQNGCAIKYITEPSEEIKWLAVQEDIDAIQFIEGFGEKQLAVQQNGLAIQHFKWSSEEVKRLVAMMHYIR